MELVFVIDSSESVGPDNFQIIKNFAKTLIDRASVNHANTRVGIINFSHQVELVSSLQQHSTKEDLKQSVEKMQYLGEGTYTASAIGRANEIFKAARPDVRKVAIVITDGQADSRDEMNLTAVVSNAHANSIEMFVIGVVSKSDPNFDMFRKEMDLIASHPDSEHVYQIDDFLTLPALENKLVKKICEKDFDSYMSLVQRPSGFPGFITNEIENGQSGRTPETNLPLPSIDHAVRAQEESRDSEPFARTNQTPPILPPVPRAPADIDTMTFGPTASTLPDLDLEKTTVATHKDSRCSEPLKPGPCRNYIVKWYYDEKANSCARFWYGNCNGNNNQFDSEKECVGWCVRH